MENDEIWREIPGLPFYEASNRGRIRSLKAGHGCRVSIASGDKHVMSGCPDAKGYLLVNCRVGMTNRTQRVHRLIARAFIGNIPTGHHINHINGDKADNRLENLEICSPKENQRHKTEVLGVRMRWNRSPNAKNLTENDIRKIRSEAAGGRLYVQIAKDYGVSAYCISNIARRKRWAQVS